MQLAKNGLGDFVSSSFVVPQNPIVAAGGTTGMGDLIGPAHFVVPQNPLKGNTTLNSAIALVSPKQNALGTSLKGLSSGTCADASLKGLGTFDISQLATDPAGFLSSTTDFTITNWMVLFGGGFLLLELFKRHRR